MDLAHGATILHGDDVVFFVVACAVALITLGGMWLGSRRSMRRTSSKAER